MKVNCLKMHKKYNILKGEYEMTTLKHQYEALVPGKSLDIPESIKVILSCTIAIFCNLTLF